MLGEDWESKPEFLAEAKAWIFRNGWGYTIFMYALAYSHRLTVVHIPSLYATSLLCLLHCRRAALV